MLSRFPWNLISGFIDNILGNPFIVKYVKVLRKTLFAVGVPQELLPTVDQVVLCSSVVIATLGSYWYWLGREHLNLRVKLHSDLSKAQQAVRKLEDKLVSIEALDETLDKHPAGKEVRIFMDGAFDMMHYGHMNAFRKARSLGTYLIAGVNSDESIITCKGPPICNDEERLGVVRGCKWVDEVVTKVPYVMTAEYLQWVIDTYKVDYVVHGDDPCIVDGKDVYEIPKKNGQFKSISRTEGISTTDIVGRMLLCTRSHHSGSFSETESNEGTPIKEMESKPIYEERFGNGFEYRKTDFLTTMNVIRLFGAGVKPPKPTDRVVYVAGAWDMFHGAHVHLLEQARKFGDYLIVGVHNDGIINSHLGMNYPIMNMQERALSVIGCKFVDDVLIDAPYDITSTMLSSLKVTAVVRGSMQVDAERFDPIDEEFKDKVAPDTPASGPRKYPYMRDPYAIPREKGILHVVPSISGLSAAEIVDRIHLQRERYKKKFAKKKAAEEEYYKERYENEAEQISKNMSKK